MQFSPPRPIVSAPADTNICTATVYTLPYLWFPHRKSKIFKFSLKGQIPEENNRGRKDGFGGLLLEVPSKEVAVKGEV